MTKPRVLAKHVPLFFVLGPSGVGKSTIAATMGERFNLLHLEIDRYPEDGIALENLRIEWDQYWNGEDARPIAVEMKSRAHSERKAGAVLSFPSGVVPNGAQLATAISNGITPVILYGPAAECLNAFLARERRTGRNFGEEHWRLNNAQCHASFDDSVFSAHTVVAFEQGKFRNASAIAKEVLRQAGRHG